MASVSNSKQDKTPASQSELSSALPSTALPLLTKTGRASTFDSALDSSTAGKPTAKKHERGSSPGLERYKPSSKSSITGDSNSSQTSRRSSNHSARHRSTREPYDSYSKDSRSSRDSYEPYTRGTRSARVTYNAYSEEPYQLDNDFYFRDPRQLPDRYASKGRHYSDTSPTRERQDQSVLQIRVHRPDAASQDDFKIEELERECVKKEKANKRLRRETSELAEENIRLQRLLDEQDARIRSMQEQHLSDLEGKGFLRAEDDDAVRHRLQGCMRKLQSWAKTYAVTSKSQVKELDQRTVQNLFRAHMVPDELVAPNGVLASKYDNIVSGILLNTMLAGFVTQWIIERPFFCLGNAQLLSKENSPVELLQVSQAFELVYQNMQQDDASTAHAWRWQTLRMVDPSNLPESTIQASSGQRKEQYYRHITTVFESSDARVLYRPCNVAQRHEELLDVMRTVGDLFSSLWKQRVFTVPWGNEKLQKMQFSVGSRTMTAHPSHRLEDGDARLNGRTVQMVVQPAILAYGNEEGRNFDESKVWAKAVVWLSQ